MTNKNSAFFLTLPVLTGYVPMGAAFGFLLVKAGADWWLAPLMSIFVFAGALQFLAVGFLAAGASIMDIAFVSLVINIRHIFYGLSVRSILPTQRFARLYSIFALTDETYSLLTGIETELVKRQALKISALNHLYWVLGGAIGAFLGTKAQIDLIGLDFTLVALFTVLGVEQFLRQKSYSIVGISILSFIISHFLFQDNVLFPALTITALFILFLSKDKKVTA